MIKETIGILPVKNINILKQVDLKEILLYFDKIAITYALDFKPYSNYEFCNNDEKELIFSKIADIEYLMDKGLVIEPKYDITKLLERLKTPNSIVCEPCKFLIDAISLELKRYDYKFEDDFFKYEEFESRLLSLFLEKIENQNTSFVGRYDTDYNFGFADKQTDTVDISMLNFPSVSKISSLEELIDFKKNTEINAHLHEFRRWLKKLSLENPDTNLLAEEYEYLVNRYKNLIHLEKKKIENKMLQIKISYPFELLENLLKLKFNKIINPILEYREQKININILENKGEGHEIMYLLKIEEKFNNR